MGYPVAYLSGNTTTYETGMFKRGTIGQNQAAALTGSYRWWNGIDVTSSQYLIYSDTFTTSATTAANATPAAWSTPDLADQSLLNLINTLPERVGKLPFTYLPVALQWIQSTGRYFLTKNGYENIVTDGQVLNLDAGWYLSYSGTGTNWKDLSSKNNNLTLVNSPLLKTDNSVYFSFDNTDDFGYIDVTSGSGLGDSNSNTLCMWVKNINNNFLMTGQYGSHFGYGFYSGGLLKNSTGQAGPSITPYYNKSYWTHLTAVWDSGNSQTRLYINGELTGTSSVSYFSNANGGRLVIGGAYNGNNTLGKEGSVDIACYHQYNRVLTTTEITQNFNAQKTRFGFTADTIVTSGLTLNLDAGDVISYPTTGTSWYDVSYVNNNATLNNGPTFVSSGVSSSILFDGSDDYVSGPNLLNGATKATLCGWVKRSSTSSQISFGVLDYPNLPTDKRIEIVWYSDGNLYGEVGNTQNDWVNTTQTVNNTNWHHISFVYDGTQPTNTTKVKLYFDGVLKTNAGSAGTIQSSVSTTGPMVIGRRNTGYNSGNISTVQFYNRNLSDAEILQNYNALKGRYGL
jgi:hypothetical protein